VRRTASRARAFLQHRREIAFAVDVEYRQSQLVGIHELAVADADRHPRVHGAGGGVREKVITHARTHAVRDDRDPAIAFAAQQRRGGGKSFRRIGNSPGYSSVSALAARTGICTDSVV
jgi:hypothetical protein